MGRGEFFFHDRHRQATRISLAGKHAKEPTHGHLPIQRTHGPELPPYQRASRFLLLLRIQLIERITRQLIVHTPAAKLLCQRPLPQPTPPMPRLNPGIRKRRIIDQPDVGEPIEHLVGHLVRNLPLSK